LQERTEGEGLVHKEAMEGEGTDSKQRKPVTFLFRGKPDIWVFKSNCMPNGSKEQDGQADEEGKASQRFRGFHLGPNELESEASPFGIADLLLNPHAAIIEGSHQGSRWPLAQMPTTRMVIAPSERRRTVPRSKA